MSNLTLGRDDWKYVDEYYKAHEQADYPYDREWDAAVRPVVARYFKAGIICPTHLPWPPSRIAVRSSTTEEHRPDILCDYRDIREDRPSQSGFTDVRDPHSVDIRQPAREYHGKSKPGARFALLRIWSGAYFYPLMLGGENRSRTSSYGIIGRAWEWKCVTKDMPGSEWSVHKSVELRFDYFERHSQRLIHVERAMVLVMAENEEKLKKHVVAVVFAIQTKPWRLEVDLWKSFVNVDIEFLKGLSEA